MTWPSEDKPWTPPAGDQPVTGEEKNWFTKRFLTSAPGRQEGQVSMGGIGAEDIDPSAGAPSIEQAAEYLPLAGSIAGGAIGTAAGGAPAIGGLALGGAAGEALRQHLRRAAGVPAATGMSQRVLGLDPNSPQAATAGLLGEAAASAAGELGARGIAAGSRALGRSALRNVKNLLQPTTAVEEKESMRLAQKAIDEGLVPAGSTRETQTQLAKDAMEKATAERTATEAGLSGESVPTERVAEKAIEDIPELMQVKGGAQRPRVGESTRKVAEDVADDILDVVGSHPGGEMPFPAAQAEKRRWDNLLRSMYERGQVNIPEGLRYIRQGADSYRRAISDAFPEMGAKNLRESDLITIHKLFKDALEAAQREGVVRGFEGSLGAAASGSTRIPLMTTAKALMGLGPWASTSSAAKRAAIQIAKGGVKGMQLYVRMGDFFSPEAMGESQTAEQEPSPQ